VFSLSRKLDQQFLGKTTRWRAANYHLRQHPSATSKTLVKEAAGAQLTEGVSPLFLDKSRHQDPRSFADEKGTSDNKHKTEQES
jgi:hypothetical protein